MALVDSQNGLAMSYNFTEIADANSAEIPAILMVFIAPELGLEPTTLRLTGVCNVRRAFVFSGIQGVDRTFWSPFGAQSGEVFGAR